MTNHDIVRTVCDLVADRPGDPTPLVEAEVRRLAPLCSPQEQLVLADRAIAHLRGLGELDAYVRDDGIDEVLVNSGSEIWIDRDGALQYVGSLGTDRVDLLIERVLAPLGRRVDRTSPIVDARLADGARVCAVLPPVAVDGPALSIRRFRRRILPLDSFTDEVGVVLLHELLDARCNLVVAGATSSGKTSLVAALVAEVDPSQRLVIVEDTAELPLRHAHALRLEARPPTIDGPGAVDLAQLVRTALRLRPDRIVVGEARGDEVLALVQAMNTGHDGSISTCHANGPTDALLRLESLVLQAAPSWPLAAIRHQLARSIDVVIHVERAADGARRITELAEVTSPSPADDNHAAPATRPLAMLDVDEHLVAVASLERRRR
ncbi:MAG TPA: ATPase, T2SS/T4P/T4SS family [Ilumatobacteraceae bacterium]|nr:ATPase, T2SS/T4P/T4SS family [Ilumatobacteraceae bacterium]